MEVETKMTARLATLDQLMQTTIPAFLDPVPCRETLRSWFDSAGIPRLKPNPLAKRGGGQVYYLVAGVEKFLRSRTLPPAPFMRGSLFMRRTSALAGNLALLFGRHRGKSTAFFSHSFHGVLLVPQTAPPGASLVTPPGFKTCAEPEPHARLDA